MSVVPTADLMAASMVGLMAAKWAAWMASWSVGCWGVMKAVSLEHRLAVSMAVQTAVRTADSMVAKMAGQSERRTEQHLGLALERVKAARLAVQWESEWVPPSAPDWDWLTS
jgi:hypothetical protein